MSANLEGANLDVLKQYMVVNPLTSCNKHRSYFYFTVSIHDSLWPKMHPQFLMPKSSFSIPIYVIHYLLTYTLLTM